MSISKKRLRELSLMKDSEIDTSDIPELDDLFWKNAKLHLPEPKISISLRIERPVLEWFRLQGPRYQSRINAVLNAYVKAHSGPKRSR